MIIIVYLLIIFILIFVCFIGIKAAGAGIEAKKFIKIKPKLKNKAIIIKIIIER